MAAALEDLTRDRVVRLPEADFAEYVRLTLPFASANATPPAPRAPTRVGRLLQHGFLYAVAATRLGLDNPGASRLRVRLQTLRLLAHFHRLAPASGGVDLAALRRGRVDVNAPEIQPVAYHYLRAAVASLGAVDRATFSEALMEAVDLAHTDERSLVGRILGRLAGGVEALYSFAEVPQGGSRRTPFLILPHAFFSVLSGLARGARLC